MTITVVGAGIVGGSIAYELASRGARVRLLDSRGVGQGATRASAGILAPYTEGHSADLLALGLRSLEMYEEFLRRVTADAGRPVEFERCGTVQVALDEQEAGALASTACVLRQRGVRHELIDGAAAAGLEPFLTARATAGLVIAPHGYVAAGSLTDAVCAAAANRGAELFTRRVLEVNEGPPGAAVSTSEGTLLSDAVVIAAGSWTSRIGLQRSGQALAAPTSNIEHVQPVRGQLVHLRAAARPLHRIVWGTRCYLVPWRDGSVLVGATVEDVGFDERSTADGVRGLLDAAVELVPALAAAELHAVRVGLRPRTADELPAMGRSSAMPGVFYAIGHYRNGVLLAPLTARLVADLVLEGREGPELARVRPARLGL